MNANPTAVRPRHAPSAGYTLLEVMLAIALIALLVGGVFATQRGAVLVARQVTENQEAAMRMNSFVELMRRNLEQTPGNARISLDEVRGNSAGGELMFKDYPLAFSWSGVSAGAKSVLLRGERNSVGEITVKVLYLNEEATQEYENGRLQENAVDKATGLPAVRQLELMTGVRNLLWSFYDETTQEWLPDWPREKNRRPSLMEMLLEMADGSEPLRLVFWVPVMANPQTFANVGGGGAPTPGVPPGGTAPPPGVTPGVTPPGGFRPPGGGPPGGGRGDRGGGGSNRGGGGGRPSGNFGGGRGGGGR